MDTACGAKSMRWVWIRKFPWVETGIPLLTVNGVKSRFMLLSDKSATSQPDLQPRAEPIVSLGRIGLTTRLGHCRFWSAKPRGFSEVCLRGPRLFSHLRTWGLLVGGTSSASIYLDLEPMS